MNIIMDNKPIDYNENFCGAKHHNNLKVQHKSNILVLPEMEIVEVQAFKVSSGIENFDLDNIEKLSNFNFDEIPISSVIKECKDLSKKHNVMIKLNGPLTIISELIGMNNLFMLWIKSPNKFNDVLKVIADNLILYASECVSSGASIISYGDAICSKDILGPKHLKNITEKFSYPFLKKLENTINKKSLLHLCPKISSALKYFDLANTKTIKLDKKMNYEEACLYINGFEAIVGSRCIEYRYVQVENIEVINLI
jgi:uroporphyrinogen-III decarboxylase